MMAVMTVLLQTIMYRPSGRGKRGRTHRPSMLYCTPALRYDRDMEKCQNFTVTHDPRGVATVAFDMLGRKYNVLTTQAFVDLEKIVIQLAESSDVRCAVFCSAKESGFVAGADIKELYSHADEDTVVPFVALGQRVFDRIEALPIPTVAVIHGPCLGGGLELRWHAGIVWRAMKGELAWERPK